MGLPAGETVRFARGTARTSPWCAVEHRVIDWASRSSFREESEVVIMIAVVTEEMHGSDRDSDLKRLRASLSWYGNSSTRAKWRSSSSASSSSLEKRLTGSALLERRCYARLTKARTALILILKSAAGDSISVLSRNRSLRGTIS